MSENGSNLDALLKSAQQEVKDKEAQRELKEKAQEEKTIQLISDLDMRWNKVSSPPTSLVTPFVSDLEINNSLIESLGFTPELMDSGDSEGNEAETLQKSLQELRKKFSSKGEAVEALLENDFLSDEKKEEIQNAWKVSSEEFKKEENKIYLEFTDKQGVALEKRRKNEQAQKNQKEFICQYRRYNASKINGEYLFKKLLGDDEDSRWFYENLLTDEERLFVEELREKQNEKGALSQKNIFNAAELSTTKRVEQEVKNRLEKTLGVKEALDELFTLEEEDKNVFAAAKKYIKDTFGGKVWKQLEKRASKQLEDLQEDIVAWNKNKKGFGKNTRENRKKRLINSAEPLRKEKEKIDKSFSDDKSIVSKFLSDLYSKRHSFLGDREGVSVDQLKNGNKVSDELQEIVRQLGKKREHDVYRQIGSIEKSTFLDQLADHEMVKRLGDVETYILHRNNIILELENLLFEKQKEHWKTSARITEILNKFPLMPNDYYSIDN